ncbi:hypothetical protein J0X14_15165 [Muricauda sp. CAU 1633]|uniref:endonuclease/exonuclease/phosphatase family protein n=1 Tax=Allomuricauda sp. CAU 1633 TaxID=2816036 RepID=UPI001A8ED98F|nr:endonuclease/exonuclease/phosphatase family protein [Muricauda sp. CAU 1633]MBO0323649.1 hypothetical protein [Muricauda sp. CAU 1633]
MKIVNWNMQGASHSIENKWNTGVQNLLAGQADVCCLQECGAIPPSAQLVYGNVNGFAGLNLYTWGTTRKHKYILFYQSDPNGNRCNLAIVSNIPIINPKICGTLLYPAAPPVRRPVIGLFVNGLAVFSIHAISPGGPDAPGLLNSVANNMGANPWSVSGDYNRDPASMAGAGIVCPPNAPTYSSTNPHKKIDYLTKQDGPIVEGQVLNLLLSDHLPVVFMI